MSGLSREDFESFWVRLDADSVASKQSQDATILLASFYRDLDEEDRTLVDEALADWIVNGDERRRFDAAVLIRDFEIRSALAALRARLAALLEDSGGPVGGERARLERVVAALS